MKYPQVQTKTVLITGCSSGIGAATAQVMRAAGWRVFPTARKPQDLDRLKQEGFEPVSLDLAVSDSVQTAVHQVLELSNGQLGGVVNNAGFAQAGAMEDVSRDALCNQFEINVFGMIELTNGLIPTFRNQGYGRIVNVSSIYGRLASPMVGSYCASKFAMEALSDAMRLELRADGIAVCIIEPGPIVSRFRKNAAAGSLQTIDMECARFSEVYRKEAERRLKQEKKPDWITRPPEDVAYKIRHALESARPKRRYLITLPAHLGAFAARFLPTSWVDHVMDKTQLKLD